MVICIPGLVSAPDQARQDQIVDSETRLFGTKHLYPGNIFSRAALAALLVARLAVKGGIVGKDGDSGSSPTMREACFPCNHGAAAYYTQELLWRTFPVCCDHGNWLFCRPF